MIWLIKCFACGSVFGCINHKQSKDKLPIKPKRICTEDCKGEIFKCADRKDKSLPTIKGVCSHC